MTARKPCPHCAAWEARYDRAMALIETLAVAKAMAPKPAARVTPAPPDAETQAIRAVEREVIEAEAKIFAMTNKIPEAQALAEVERLRGIALNTRVDVPT